MSAENEAPIVLITGAARRVGAEIARQIHAAGAHVILHYRRAASEAEALAASLNTIRAASACTIQANLAIDGEPETLAEKLFARHGRIDGLVNNASSFFPTPLGGIDRAIWDDLIGSNLKGPLFLSQALAPALKVRHGSIINIVDIHAMRPLKNYPLYCAAKAGLAGLTRALAIELAPEVRVNAVAPGPIEWPEDGQINEQQQRHIVAHTLLRQEGSPADIGSAVRFLMFEARYVTGQILTVDGGRSIHL